MRAQIRGGAYGAHGVHGALGAWGAWGDAESASARQMGGGMRIGLSGDASEMAGVTVTKVSSELSAGGLLVGDVMLAVNVTVVRNSTIASKAFGMVREGNELQLQLLGWNKEVRVAKHAGVVGFTCATPTGGAGVLVTGLTGGGAADEAGIHIGDRILAISSQVAPSDPEAANKLMLSASGDVR